MQSIWNGRLGVEPLCRLDSQCCVSSVSFCLVLFACSISCLIVRINGVHSPPPGRMLLLPAGAVGPLLLLLRMKKKRQAPAYDCWLIWSQDWAHRRGCDIGSCVRLSVIAAVARHKDKRNVSTCSSCSVERVGSGICSFFFCSGCVWRGLNTIHSQSTDPTRFIDVDPIIRLPSGQWWIQYPGPLDDPYHRC